MLPGLLANAVLCLLYIALNGALNFVNRAALGPSGFAFPLTLTAAHMLLNPVLLAPLMIGNQTYRQQHIPVVCGSWSLLLMIGALNAIQIGLNNSSLVHIELSLNQVVRGLMPVFVGLLHWLRVARPPPVHLLLLSCISLGVALVVYRESSAGNEWLGIFYVTASVGLQAAQMSFSDSLLSTKLDSFQITFYTSWPALLALAAPALWLEGPQFLRFAAERPAFSAAVLCGTCFLAVLYNVVMYQTIRRLNAVGSAVLGNVKVVVLLLLSSMVLGEMKLWTSRQHLGCMLTLGGAAAYSSLKLRRAAKTD